jgi:DNA-binding SARP family transcriptional activator
MSDAPISTSISGSPEDSELIERLAFRALPFAAAIVGASRRIVLSNGLAGELIESVEPRPEHCCELVCNHAPAVGGCLRDLARTRGGPLPEIRIEIPLPSGPVALWVTVAPLADSELTIFHCRPATAGDRRRRTDPHWMAGPSLHVRALGRTEVYSAEGPIGGAWMGQRVGQVFKLLITERHRVVPADEIAENIWPGSGPTIAASVRYYVHALRTQLEPGRAKRRGSSFVVSRHGGYTLDLARITVDVDEFERNVRVGGSRLNAGEDEAAAVHLERAIELYGGDFLLDEAYAPWALHERGRLQDLAARALGEMAELELRRGREEPALDHFSRLAALMPFDDLICRRYLEVAITQGRRTEAIRHYEAYSQRMSAEFGEKPDFTLSDLAH